MTILIKIGVYVSNRSIFLSTGNAIIQIKVTPIVIHPPIITDGTNPKKAALKPDSNSPSSLDAPINTEFTALTRPRISSL